MRRSAPVAVSLAGLALAGCARSEPVSLLLISLDTLRADRLGSYGSARGLTPGLDALAREAVLFEDVSCPVPLTTPSHASLFTARLPSAHGVRTNDGPRLGEQWPTLADHLRQRGYRTAGFPGAAPLASSTGLARGFERWDDAFLETPGVVERPASQVLAAASAWIREQSRGREPFFALVHLFDAHSPYQAPEPFAARFPDAPYDAEVAALDAELERFLAALRAEGILDRSVVSVVADHGEGLGEHGERSHGALLYESTLRVPWLVRLPQGRLAGYRVAAPVRSVDVAPTLLGWLGLPGLLAADGVDLAPAVEAGSPVPELPVVAETRYLSELLGWAPLASLRRGSHKLIAGSRLELFELSSDAGEQQDRARQDRFRARRLESELAELNLSRTAPLGAAASAESAERLAALGYVAGRTDAPAPSRRDPRDGMAIWHEIESGMDRLRASPASARAHFARALELDPGNGLALKSLGDVALAEGEPETARAHYQAALAAGFAHPDLERSLAAAESDLGHPERALALLAGLPADADLEAERARLELECERPEAALALARAALARDPDHAAAALAAARSLRALDRVDQAQAALEAMLVRRPDQAGALNELGLLLAERGLMVEAERHLNAALRASPGAAAPRRNLAQISADPRRAEALLREALELEPGFVAARRDLARRLAEAGRLEAARREIVAALARRPDDPEALFIAARVADLGGRRGEARALYRRFLERAGTGMEPAVASAKQRLAELGAAGG